MAEWFDGLDFETEARWSYATFFFDYRIWKNHNAVRERINEQWPDDSAGERLNRIGRIERAAASIAAFEGMFLDSSIWVLGPPTVRKEYKKAEAAWIEGCQQWFGGNGEIPWTAMDENGEDVEYEEVVSFGPWCIWLKPRWETLVHNFELFKTKQQLDREADQAREKEAPRILPGSADDEEEMKDHVTVDDDNHNHGRDIRRNSVSDKNEMDVEDESDHGIERQPTERRKKKKQVRIRENRKKSQRKKRRDQDSDYIPSDRYMDLNGSDDETRDNIFREESTEEDLSDAARHHGGRTKRKKDLRYLSPINSSRSNNHNVRNSRKSKSHSHQKRHSRSRSRSRSRDNHRERERRDRKSRSRHRSRHSKSRKSKSKSTQSNYRLSVSDAEEVTDEV